MSKSKEHKIPILSFFSGGGFMDMGFEQTGFEVIWTNEYDADFAQLHTSGITSWRRSIGNNTKAEIFNKQSITEVSSDQIIAEAFPDGVPEYFGMIGGPPCQDFSLNGKLKGFNGERGKLTAIYLDKVLELKPTFFVMENVTGLINRKETKDFLKTLLKQVEEEYIIDFEKLNALNFGVPQSRERVFFIGIKKTKISLNETKKDSFRNWFPFPINELYKNSASKYVWGTENDFGSLVIKPLGLPIELCVESCLVSDKDIETVPNANEYFQFRDNSDKLNKIKEGETNRPSFRRLHRYRYSPTACYGNNEVHLHPYKNRRISVREALRIQGVADTYLLPPEISKSKKFKMIANGVPVPLAKAIAEQLFKFLKEKVIFLKDDVLISF